MISGRKCAGSWQMSLPGTSLPRTSADARLIVRQTTSSRWVTRPTALPSPRRTWVAITFGSAFGYVHTPTTIANYAAPSMQKHPCCRAFVRAFGKPTPQNHEFLMGWPEGWTDLRPLEMDRFQRWLSLHGDCSAVDERFSGPSTGRAQVNKTDVSPSPMSASTRSGEKQ
jgi:hypothetical protein